MAVPTTVDEYLADLSDEPRAVLEALRRTIRSAAPDATELISYGMPAFKHKGRFLVSYAAYRDHCSLFPASEGVRRALAEELAPNFSGKGTVRFPADQPLPTEVVRKLVAIRMEEIETGGLARRQR